MFIASKYILKQPVVSRIYCSDVTISVTIGLTCSIWRSQPVSHYLWLNAYCIWSDCKLRWFEFWMGGNKLSFCCRSYMLAVRVCFLPCFAALLKKYSEHVLWQDKLSCTHCWSLEMIDRSEILAHLFFADT